MRKQVVEFIIIIFAVLLIREYLAQAYNIPSGSMIPTLLVGDFILVNKLVYKVSEPYRGDMIVFKSPENPKIDFIKRIIAKGGDKVDFVPYEDNGVLIYKVFVNGREFSLEYKGYKKIEGRGCYEYEETIFRDNGEVLKHSVCFKRSFLKTFGILPYAIDKELCLKYTESFCTSFIVPEGYYFVMGDNRDNSEDSRYWGFVPKENIVGKAFVIYYSGKTPPLTPRDVGPFTVIRQIVYALLNPRFSRIGKPLIH